MVGSGKKERSGGLCREAYAAIRNGRRLLGRICSLFDNCLEKEKINRRKKKTTQNALFWRVCQAKRWCNSERG